ncbi:BTB and MATH domain-containing protein 41 [Pichia californica]|uniref:BTB and MATH domain-containing protein 41 n=1 Tax=Pichia californica TaxID=460514 RepID=A0A9P6WKM3_9ASCO|nr:BTB and MATH domain-containing protein 41 [[Candida] californica]KAG0688890.1 BTB and MATH domain-containing protein 41 [[Candida] californica]
MKNTLPATAKVSKDAKECMQECVSEFISFVTSEASDRCLMEKRKTINGEDVLYSLHTLGFENYAEVLKIYLAKYRQQQALKQERGEIRQKKKKKKVIIENENNANIISNINQSQDLLIPANNNLEEDNSNSLNMKNNIRNNNLISKSNLNSTHSIDTTTEIFEYPMDESMTVIRGNGIHEEQDNNDNNNSDNNNSDNNNNDNDDEQNKSVKYDPYVSQLYEQEYAGVSMHMTNPDYKGSASESITLKKSHMIKSNINNNDINNISVKIENTSGINDENHVEENINNQNQNQNKNEIKDKGKDKDKDKDKETNHMSITNTIPLDVESLGMDINDDDVDDDNVGVGVNVHLGNSESLDEINSRLNRNVNDINDKPSNNNNNNNNSDNNNNNNNSNNDSNSIIDLNGKSSKIITKTPATTNTSDFLLLNDNITGISESEEIVGLTNGHSGMYRFE